MLFHWRARQSSRFNGHHDHLASQQRRRPDTGSGEAGKLGLPLPATASRQCLSGPQAMMLAALMLAAGCAVGAEPVAVPSGDIVAPARLDALHDRGGRLSRDALLKPPACEAFAAQPNPLRLGPTPDPVWARIFVAPAPGPWLLRIPYAPLSRLCVHWPVADGRWAVHCTAAQAVSAGVPTWDGGGYRIRPPGGLDAGRPVLIEASSPLWLKLPVTLGAPDAIDAGIGRSGIGWGLYFGLMLALAAQAAALAWTTQSRVWTHFALHFGALTLTLAAWKGHLLTVGLPAWTATHLPAAALSVFVAAGAGFFRHLLDTADGLPVAHRMLQAVGAAAVAGLPLAAWRPHLALLLLAVCGLLYAPAALSALLRRALDGHGVARAALLSQAPLLGCAALKAIETLHRGLVDPALGNALVYASALFSALLLAFVIDRDQRRSTSRRLREQELALLDHQLSLARATIDPITGLPSRERFLEELASSLSGASRGGAAPAVVSLGLDRFGTVNHALGMSAGDAVLRETAGRLRRVAGEGACVARVGPDQFALLLDYPDDGALVERCGALLDAISAPHPEADSLRLSASIGAARFPDHGLDAPTLLRHADAAMHAAKAIGGGAFQMFQPELTERAGEQLRISAQLEPAIAAGEFVLHYQPIVSLPDGAMIGLEALMRWQRPDGRTVPPDRFIPVAERTGLITRLTEQALDAACAQLSHWRSNAGIAVHVAVNLSPRQFRAGTLVDQVQAALQRHGLPGGALVLEITEGLLVEDPDVARRVLQALRRIGIGIAIDDFGVGYSSLSYLRDLPVTHLKIDRSFLRGVPDDRQACTMVNSILHMAGQMGLAVVAEGVETTAQRDFLVAAGCTRAQGWLFGKAMPPDAVADWLAGGRLGHGIG